MGSRMGRRWEIGCGRGVFVLDGGVAMRCGEERGGRGF